mmetsp:Transcript_10428/g.26773  ORF Transcript_10428/g.26773 Transcript_10428/m.26773 type:complete len:471 (-) Transcript_10428:34-1446(-)
MFIEHPCDHFDAERWNCTFQHKYFIDDHAWKGASNADAMITFIPGGESAMGGMYNYEILRELAYSRGGIVITMEHRFYGDSIPGGPDVKVANMGLLTIEQAMADYADLISRTRAKYECPHCPVVAGGGSYSGKLAAYMRLKYPSIVDMALAASAPVFLDSPGFDNSYRYYEIVTNATRKLSPKCPEAVRAAIATLLASDSITITQELNLCEPLDTVYGAGKGELLQRIMNQFADTAMGNYPPSNSPITAECKNLLSAPHGSLRSLRLFLDDRYKFVAGVGLEVPNLSVPEPPCYNLTSARAAGPHGHVVCSDWSGCGAGLNAEIWDYQACTEVIQPLGTNNKTDMFWPREWTLKWQTDHCMSRFNAKPLRNGKWLAHTMGLDSLFAKQPAGFSRVIWSNGMQDPWSAGGVLDDIGETLIAIKMENGAHHVDLRPAEPTDTADVILARKREREILTGWLEQASLERRPLKP